MKQRLAEETSKEIIDAWFAEADKMKAADLPNFIAKLVHDYDHDYGTICHAITAAGIAAMHAVNHSDQGGITGFQAGAIFWEFTRRWGYLGEGPKKMVLFSNLLYPQYESSFEKTISKETWTWLQAEAKKNLNETKHASASVISHWQSIVDGNLPFGFKLEREE